MNPTLDFPRGCRRPRWSCGLVACWLAVVAGCHSEGLPKQQVYEVKGQVLAPDGKPVPGGTVCLVPRDGLLTSQGEIGGDGTFRVSTGGSGEGAPAGEYKVRIEPSDKALLVADPRKFQGKKLPVPPRYWDEDRSGLTVVVKPEANQLEPFRLK